MAVWLLILILLAAPVGAEDSEDFIAEGYDLRFELRGEENLRFPIGWARVSLGAVAESSVTFGAEPLEGTLPLGSHGEAEGLRVALARKSAGRPYTLLAIDRDRDGSFHGEEVLRGRSEKAREKIRFVFESSVLLERTSNGALVRQQYPVVANFTVDTKRDTPSTLFFQHRNLPVAEVDLNGFEYEVVLSDRNHDGVFEAKDSWSLRPQYSGAATRPRSVAGSVRARGFAWKLELTDTDGTTGRLVRFEAAEQSHRPRGIDRRARRAGWPLPFTNQAETAIAAAKQRGIPYFLDFTADWCAPCRQMDENVYTAAEVVEAAGKTVCIKVENEAAHAAKLKQRYRVASYPTGILFGADGKEVDRFRGYRSVQQMVEFFQQVQPDRPERTAEVEP